jgi:hypothetical protein
MEWIAARPTGPFALWQVYAAVHIDNPSLPEDWRLKVRLAVSNSRKKGIVLHAGGPRSAEWWRV